MPAGKRPVAIIMGSKSDWKTMRHAAKTLKALKVGYADGSLLKLVPKEGELRDQLLSLGVITPENRELLGGCGRQFQVGIDTQAVDAETARMPKQQQRIQPRRLDAGFFELPRRLGQDPAGADHHSFSSASRLA